MLQQQKFLFLCFKWLANIIKPCYLKGCEGNIKTPKICTYQWFALWSAKLVQNFQESQKSCYKLLLLKQTSFFIDITPTVKVKFYFITVPGFIKMSDGQSVPGVHFEKVLKIENHCSQWQSTYIPGLSIDYLSCCNISARQQKESCTPVLQILEPEIDMEALKKWFYVYMYV